MSTSRFRGAYDKKSGVFAMGVAGRIFSSASAAAQEMGTELDTKGLSPQELVRRMHFMNQVYNKGDLPADLEGLWRGHTASNGWPGTSRPDVHPTEVRLLAAYLGAAWTQCPAVSSIQGLVTPG